jgi:hypothetical protein
VCSLCHSTLCPCAAGWDVLLIGSGQLSVAPGVRMNLLFLCPYDLYQTKMSRVRFEEIDALEKIMTVTRSGPGWSDWPAGMQPLQYVREAIMRGGGNSEQTPHLVLSYKVEGLQGSPIPVAILFHETYNRVQTLRAIRDTGATLVLFTYRNDIAQYEAEMSHEGRDLAVIPHSADAGLYRDYSTDEAILINDLGDERRVASYFASPFDPGYKHIDVLIVGNLARDFYPFRARLARLAHREIRKRGYAVAEALHPGFTLPARPQTFVGADYARLLNRSKLVLTCTGKHHYAFNKLVEIPLCWSLPVSDLPAERQGFFKQTLLNVEMWHTDREILYKMEEVLDDAALLRALTTRAHDKVEQRLTLAHWAERFLYCARRHVWKESPELPTPPVGEEDA